MTDYFALFDRLPQPWLDPEELKEAFHAKARDAHPDAELNEAYQTLRDPKRRLQHLLKLSGADDRSPAIPAAINDLFPVMAGLTREVDQLSELRMQASSALSRSLLAPRLAQAEKQLETTLAGLNQLREQALVRLPRTETADHTALQKLQAEFSYLDRWIAELDERKLKLEL